MPYPLNHNYDDIEVSKEIEYRIIDVVVEKKKGIDDMIIKLMD